MKWGTTLHGFYDRFYDKALREDILVHIKLMLPSSTDSWHLNCREFVCPGLLSCLGVLEICELLY